MKLIVGVLDSKTATRLVDDAGLSAYFDKAVLHCWAFYTTDNLYWQVWTNENGSTEIRSMVASVIFGELSRLANVTGESIIESNVTPLVLGEVVGRYMMGEIVSAGGAKTLLELLWREGGTVSETVEREGLEQISDRDTIKTWVNEVIARNEKIVATYKGGKTNVLGALVGQVLKASAGKANPTVVNALLLETLTE